MFLIEESWNYIYVLLTYDDFVYFQTTLSLFTAKGLNDIPYLKFV